MGFGLDPFGLAPAGLDLPATTERRDATTPQALVLDGPTRQFVVNADGRFASTHWVDAKLFNRLRIRKGSVRSAPELGNDVGNLEYIDPLTIDAYVRDQIRLVTEDMIAAGEIAERSVELDLSERGRVAYAYNYVNLLTGRPDTFRGAL